MLSNTNENVFELKFLVELKIARSKPWSIPDGIIPKNEGIYRRIFKISWREMMTNEEVFRRTQEVKSFLRNLKGRRAKFISHILRHNGLVKRMIEGTIEGKNHRGQPRLDYMKQVMVDMNCTCLLYTSRCV